MKDILRLLRPHQWLKNTFVFLPLFFDGKMFDLGSFLPTICAFFAFSFAASGIYCLNDLIDVEVDSKHPKKCKRPIASGVISKRMGVLLLFACLLFSWLFVLLIENKEVGLGSVIAFYLCLNILYCFLLKQIAIVDVFIIAVGFVLRVFAGGLASGITLSHWIVLMTFLLALFLAFAKRRDDIVIYEETGVLPRKNVSRYNLLFMNQVIGIVSTITMVCYIMYTVSPDVISRFSSQYVYLTSIFVLAGIVRYLQLTIVDVKSGSPTKVLMKDRFIQMCILCWVLGFVVIIYCK